MSPLQQPLAIIVLTLRMSKTAASAFSLLRQARITLAPLFARSRAVALPMPVLLPVQDNDSHILIHTELIHIHTLYHTLQSSSTIQLFAPSANLITMGSRAFSRSAPSLCDSLPLDIHTFDTVSTFKSRLQTHLF